MELNIVSKKKIEDTGILRRDINYVNSAHLLPTKNDHLKIIQNIQFEKDGSTLVSSDHSVAWDSKNKLDNPIHVLVANHDGPI